MKNIENIITKETSEQKNAELTSYYDICHELFGHNHYYIDDIGKVKHGNKCTTNTVFCDNNSVSKNQLVCILAKNKLANTAVCLNDGWKPSNNDAGWVLNIIAGVLMPIKVTLGHYNGNVFFKTNELARQAVEILGVETIKLALKPLGI